MVTALKQIFLAVLLAASLIAPTVGAQVLDYGSLLGQTEQTEPRQSRPLAPRGSLESTVAPPTATDYAALKTSDPMLGAAKNAIDVFRARLVDTLSHIPDLKSEVATTLVLASPTNRASYFVGVALFAALLLLIGRGAWRIYAVYIARPLLVAAQRPNPVGYLEKLPVLAYRIILTVIGTALTLGIAGGVGLIFYSDDPATQYTVFVIFAAYGVFMTVDTIWRMALAPYLVEYRLPILGDKAARKLYRSLTVVSLIGIMSFSLNSWMTALDLPEQAQVLVMIFGNLALVISLIVMLVANRHEITELVLSGRDQAQTSWVTLAAARLWMPVSLAYLVAAWGKLAFERVMGIDTVGEELLFPYMILMIGLVAYALASYAIERVFTTKKRIDELNARSRAEADSRADLDRQAEQATDTFGSSADMDGDGDEEGGGTVPDEAPPVFVRGNTMRTFEDLARRIASLFAIGAGAWVLIYFWGGLEIFAENAALGVAEDLIDILFIGYITYHAARIWIDQKIEEEGIEEVESVPLDGEGGGTGATRLATLLPLIRNFVLTVILVALVLVVATEMGVNVAPLFAGAGIVGLAIGFGSQALVRDILSGAFFLMDDAFRKGEYIDIGDVKGTVEKISIRSFQLRHHLGMLHTIPFGEIQYLTNFSRDWVMMKLPLRVTYDTDVERVRKLIKKLGQQLMDDPVVGPNFLQPLKSQGVIQMDDSAMIIRVKFMTKPGDQWVVRKRVFQEIRDLFDREGIKFAHREVTVRIPDLPTDRPPSDDEVKAIGAAARRIGDDAAGELVGAGAAVDDR